MAQLDDRSLALRRVIVSQIEKAGRGHLGSALSIVEILRVLYDEVLLFDAKRPDWADRDRCILSKGHGCLALYAILAEKGFFPADELDRVCKAGSILEGHPSRGIPGVETTTGSLGHGLPIGVGMALGNRLHGRTSRVYVLLGDGELDEGSVWEAAMIAAKYRLTSLTAIVDRNGVQSYGATAEVLDLEPLADKWRAFGFTVVECDGHDTRALGAALRTRDPERPVVTICRTIKGKGIAFIEHDLAWHHKAKVTKDEILSLYAALGGASCATPA